MTTGATFAYSHRSVSQFGSFTRCGESYRLEKVVKAPRTPAAWFFQGTAFHEAIEFWEASGRTANLAAVHAVYDAAWQAGYAKALEQEPDTSKWLTGGRKKPENDIRDREARGREQVTDYIAWANSQPWRVLQLAPDEYAVETEFSLDLDGINVKGSIDQTIVYPDGGILVRDLKTGSKLPEWPFQLAVYRLALSEELGIETVWGDYYMAKNTDTTSPYNLTRYTRDIVAGWFKKMDEAEKAGIYLPNPGDACRTCGVSQFCLAIGSRSDEFSPYRKELD